MDGDYGAVDVETVLASTNKLLRVMRQEADHDYRDAMAFQRIMGPEDIFAERIRKGRGDARRLLWKATFPGNLDKAQSGIRCCLMPELVLKPWSCKSSFQKLYSLSASMMVLSL